MVPGTLFSQGSLYFCHVSLAALSLFSCAVFNSIPGILLGTVIERQSLGVHPPYFFGLGVQAKMLLAKLRVYLCNASAFFLDSAWQTELQLFPLSDSCL